MNYDGFKNYETMAMYKWIHSDKVMNKYLFHMRYAYSDPEGLAAQLKPYVLDANPLADEPSVYSDILTTALNRIDWLAVAEEFIREWFSINAHRYNLLPSRIGALELLCIW